MGIPLRSILLPLLLPVFAAAPLTAQEHAPGGPDAGLPSAEQVLADYYQAAGGRDRLAAIRDVTVEWRTEAGGRTGSAVSMRMAPGSLHEALGNGAANVSTPALVWRRRPDGSVSVDSSSARVAQSRLQASLEASHLVGLAEQGIAARVVGADSVDGERVHRVEFARDGASRVWLFGARSRLPLRIELPGGMFIRYSDFRPVDGVLEAYRVEITNGQPGAGILFVLQSIRHNTGLTDADFLPAAAPSPSAPSQP
jgi:hypothetical protein